MAFLNKILGLKDIFFLKYISLVSYVFKDSFFEGSYFLQFINNISLVHHYDFKI